MFLTAYPSLPIAKQVATAAKEIAVQLIAYPSGYIGILCPLQDDLIEAWKLIEESDIADSSQLQRFENGYEPFDSERRVIVTTLHGAKGLEFRALHLLAADTVKRFPLQRNMSYTAVTRAKTSLALYHEGDLPGYLEKGLSALDNADDPDPDIDSLFLKRDP